MLDTRDAKGEFESRNLAPGDHCDLNKLQAKSHQVSKFRAKGYLREVAIPEPKKPVEAKSDEGKE
jgi:hypothetical protein